MNFSPDDPGSDLRDLFFESAEEIVQSLNEAGLALEERPGDIEQLRSVRRAVHTLKGDSAACGCRELSELAHELEDVLTPELATEHAALLPEVVLAAADTFHEMLAAYRSNLQPPAGGALREHIRKLLAKSAAPERARASAASAATFAWTEYESLVLREALGRGETVLQIALYLDRNALLPGASIELIRKALASAGKVLATHPDLDNPPAELTLVEAAVSTRHPAEWVRERCQIPSVVSRLTVEPASTQPAAHRDLLEILVEAEAAARSGPASRHAAHEESKSAEVRPGETDDEAAAGLSHAVSENTLRVDAGRIDAVMNLVGELIIGKSMLHRAIGDFERRFAKDPLRGKFSDALAFQSRVLNELQKSVMKIRMVPVEQLFRRFPRVVRDVAKLRGKDIALELAGQNTDLDKSILDAVADPLAHLVRNAADHGIEPTADRQAAGKAARGCIRLNAYHEGDQVVIEVSDDGRGLDRQKILLRAIEQGLVQAEDSRRLNEPEILQLIFAPGLSTADEVTEISGRGVGLDVVKSTLENLKGSVQVQSEPGKGTTFRLLVPLTLASIQALLFRVAGRLYAVPLASVVEITRVEEGGIHRVEDKEVFQLREQVLTLVRLDRLTLGQSGIPIRADSAEPSPSERVSVRGQRLFVIVIGAGARRFGLAVDSLMGEEELVIKPLEDRLITSPLVSGASILGDGTVVLILNVSAVVGHLSRIPAVGATA